MHSKNALATALGGPTGKTSELGQNPKKCKIEFFPLLSLEGYAIVPLTIIWDSEHDYALKNALATTLGGPTGKISQ